MNVLNAGLDIVERCTGIGTVPTEESRIIVPFPHHLLVIITLCKKKNTRRISYGYLLCGYRQCFNDF